MPSQKQDEKHNNGGRAGQALAVQHREQAPATRRIVHARPSSLIHRLFGDLDDRSPFGMTSPFIAMRRMFEELDRALEGRAFGDDVWLPRIEVSQRDDKLAVRVDLPGISQDQIRLSTAGNALVIEGEREEATSEERGDVWSSERTYGSFRRVVALPEGADPDRAEARYENGVLEITVPIPAMQTRRIEIQASDKDKDKDKSEARPAPAQAKEAAQPSEKH
jgi:HSP20 family protein